MQRFAADCDPETLVEAVRADGLAVVENVLSPDEVDAVVGGLRRLLDDTALGHNSFLGHQTKRVFALLAKTRAADAMAIHPLALAVLDAILGKYQMSAPLAVQIGPGEKAQTLHRDASSYPLRQHDGGDLVVNVMWALDDFTAENGATRAIPGSHLWPDESAASEDRTIQAVMPRGSICVFVGNLVHGGGANRSDRPRLGVIMEYAAAWLRPQENLCLSIPPDVARTLPPRLAELIGYDLYPPFLGYVDGRHPRVLLEGAP